MNNKLGKIKYALSVMIYGTVGLFVSYISLPSEVIVLFRGFIGALFVVSYMLLTGKKIDFTAIKKNGFMLILSGICLGLNWVFLFSAYKEMSDAVSSLCNYTAPAIVVLISPLIYKEKLNLKKTASVGVALLGIVFISGIFDKNGGDTSVTVLGFVYAFLASFTFVGLILCNRRIKNISNYDKTFVQLLMSGITALPYTLINNIGNTIVFDTRSVILSIVLGIIHTGLAYLFYFEGIGSLPVTTIALIGYLEPVITVILSVAVLGEPLGIFGIIGAVLVIGATATSELIKS